MMQCRYWMLLVAILPVAAGCGGSGGAESPATGEQAQATEESGDQQPASTAPSGPAAAVFDFLEAVRTGNDKKAAAMLTETARAETSKMGMEVAPPGSDTASFKIGEVQYLPEGRASVACTWSDRDDNGQTRTYEFTWVLRDEKEGWRVGGMVATLLEGMPPTLLNFEDPQDMVRQQQLLLEEKRRRNAERQSQAQRPPGPPGEENPIRR